MHVYTTSGPMIHPAHTVTNVDVGSSSSFCRACRCWIRINSIASFAASASPSCAAAAAAERRRARMAVVARLVAVLVRRQGRAESRRRRGERKRK